MVSPTSASWAWTGPNRPKPGNEGEQQVLDDEDPGEDADDGSDLVAEDRPEADADPAPERVPATVPRSSRASPAVEREVDAAAGEER